MKSIHTTLCLLAATASIALCSCSRHPDIIGTWEGMPTLLSSGIPTSADATASMTFTFTADQTNSQTDNGLFSLSALIDANQHINDRESIINLPYETSIAATATVSGKWAFEDDDDDDIILTFEPNTLHVNIDPQGVIFTQDLLQAGAQQPQLDSLTTATVSTWEKSLTRALRAEFYSISKISDIKIKSGIMSCEINDRDITFRKSGN